MHEVGHACERCKGEKGIVGLLHGAHAWRGKKGRPLVGHAWEEKGGHAIRVGLLCWMFWAYFVGYPRPAKWAVLGLSLGPNKRNTKNKNKIQQNSK